MDPEFKKKLIAGNKEIEKRRLIAQGLTKDEETPEEKKNKRLKQFGQGFQKALEW
jgi:hypothetical protein